MTRPQEAAECFMAQLPANLRARLDPLFSPLVAIEPIAAAIEFGDARGLIFTSANGVGVAGKLTRRRDLPCYCVGMATTRAAQKAGWQANCAGTEAKDLIRTLAESQPERPLLHIRGVHGRGKVAARLSALGCLAREQVIYDQPLLPLTQAARTVLACTSPVIVPLFSPRTARQFANLVAGQAPRYLAALSAAVAKPLSMLKYNNLMIAEHPDAGTMAQLVGDLVNDAERVEGIKSAQ